MCLAVYLASDTRLPLIPWRQSAPGLFVSDSIPDVDSVRSHLTKSYVYVVGTHTGCGCGFLYDGVPSDGPEYSEVHSMYQDFVAYLRAHATAETVEIYTCWGGDERSDPEWQAQVEVREIGSDGFAFRERQLLAVEMRN